MGEREAERGESFWLDAIHIQWIMRSHPENIPSVSKKLSNQYHDLKILIQVCPRVAVRCGRQPRRSGGDGVALPLIRVTGPMIICMQSGCGMLWHNRNAYLGLRFERSDGTHYWWAAVK